MSFVFISISYEIVQNLDSFHLFLKAASFLYADKLDDELFLLKVADAKRCGWDTVPAFRHRCKVEQGKALRAVLLDAGRQDSVLHALYRESVERYSAKGWVKLEKIVRVASATCYPERSRAGLPANGFGVCFVAGRNAFRDISGARMRSTMVSVGGFAEGVLLSFGYNAEGNLYETVFVAVGRAYYQISRPEAGYQL